MTYKVKITMDNGQSKVILVRGNDRSELMKELVWIKGSDDSSRQFISADTEDGNYFTYCVSKLSTIEFLN